MGRRNFLSGTLVIGGVALLIAVAPGMSFAKPKVSGVLNNYNYIGNGTATDDKSGTGCQDPNYPNLACPSGDFCACVTANGAIKAPNGSTDGVTTEFSLDFANNTSLYGTPNGTGGYCFGASGVGIVTTPNGDELDLQIQGTNCDNVPTGTSPDQVFGSTFSGTYTMVGGTGKFASANGTGAFSQNLTDVNTTDTPATFSLTGSLGH